MSSASSARALNAILPLISAGQPYEAHQKARTFASRYQKSGHYDTAIDVLFQSARELLRVGQQGSGTDLTSFLLEVYDTKGEEPNDESRGKPAAVAVASFNVLISYNRTTYSAYRSCWVLRELEENHN